MSEKKSFVMSFDYDESADNSGMTFGIADPVGEVAAIGELFMKEPETSKGTSVTAFLVKGIESGAISGGMLMTLATAGIDKALKIAVMKNFSDMLKGFKGLGDSL